MSFGNPSALWLLGLGVPILLLHFYRGRIRKLPVPTLMFWEQVLVEEERRTAIQRLRHYASLLLNLAALVVLTSAVADPRIGQPKRIAVILDDTASMGTVEADGRTRLETALERARGVVRSLARGDRVSVHGRIPFTEDLERVARGLEVPPLARRADAGARVRAVLASGEDVTAVLFTDRVPEGLQDERVRVVRVGSVRRNAGWISGVPVRRAGEKKVTLSLEAANFSDARADREAVLFFEGRELERRKLGFAPGERRAVEWVLDPSRFPGAGLEEGGGVRVTLEPADALPLDDSACFVVPPLRPPLVIVFHPGRPNTFLMRALHAMAAEGLVHHEVGEAPAARYPAVRAGLGEGSIAVFDRSAPQEPPGRGGILIFGAPGKGTVVERPSIADWDRRAPPNRWVDYSGLGVRRSRILQGRPLLSAVEGPLATWSSGGGRAVVEFGFTLEDTNPMHLAFPMVLFNFVEWAAFRGTRTFAAQHLAGEPLDGQPAAPGFVRVGPEGDEELVAVNVFDAAESDLREPSDAPEPPPEPSPAPWHARIPYAVVAAAAGILLLLVEWWLFHRGLI
jgi:hypothetical protein